MSDDERPIAGTIGWHDLTVPEAQEVRDFYAAVVGWEPRAVDMGGYSDFNMAAADGVPAAGVCHRRGTNADMPAQWLMYVHVADLDASLAACLARGGGVVAGPKEISGQGRYAVIRDPAGAVAALFEAG